MKELKLLFATLAIIAFSMIHSNGQNVILETAFGEQSYSGSDQTYGSAHFKVGYRFENNLSLDFSLGGSQASYDIRMPDISVSKSSWGGILVNLVTGSNNSNWSKTEIKKVYKRYFRNMKSYNLTAGVVVSDRLKIYGGPAIRRNCITTEFTNETTYDGRSLSDLEFDDYTNFGVLAGMNYMWAIGSSLYFVCDVQLQADLLTTSNKIAHSDYIGPSFTYGLGFGLRL